MMLQRAVLPLERHSPVGGVIVTGQRITKAYEEGWGNGVAKMKDRIVDILHDMYLKDPKPERGTPEAEAILTITRDLIERFKQENPTAER